MSSHSYLLISTAIHGSSEYIIIPEQVLTWDEADAVCGLLGGSLVVFEDNEEFDYMKTLLSTCKFIKRNEVSPVFVQYMHSDGLCIQTNTFD